MGVSEKWGAQFGLVFCWGYPFKVALKGNQKEAHHFWGVPQFFDMPFRQVSFLVWFPFETIQVCLF